MHLADNMCANFNAAVGSVNHAAHTTLYMTSGRNALRETADAPTRQQ